MRDIDTYLNEGTINVASEGLLFTAEFITHKNNTVLCRKKSDKGLEHLLGLLAAEVSGDKTIQEEIDKKYPYSLAVTGDYNEKVEYQLINSFFQVVGFEGKYAAMIKEVQIPIDAPIGLYFRNSNYKNSILEAITEAVLSRKSLPLYRDSTNPDLLRK